MNHIRKQAEQMIHFPPYVTEADRNETACKVKRCIEWLHLQGFRVLGVQVGVRNPRISIEADHRCHALQGAVRRFERVGKAERHYWVAIRFDCEVRWEVES